MSLVYFNVHVFNSSFWGSMILVTMRIHLVLYYVGKNKSNKHNTKQQYCFISLIHGCKCAYMMHVRALLTLQTEYIFADLAKSAHVADVLLHAFFI